MLHNHRILVVAPNEVERFVISESNPTGQTTVKEQQVDIIGTSLQGEPIRTSLFTRDERRLIAARDTVVQEFYWTGGANTLEFTKNSYTSTDVVQVVEDRNQAAWILGKVCANDTDSPTCFYELRVYDRQVEKDQNLLAKVVFDTKPLCTGFSPDTMFEYSLCLTRGNVLTQHKLHYGSVLEFQTADIDYTFSGDIRFCYRNTDICKIYDVPVHGGDANKYQIKNKRSDMKGNEYEKP